ncbi:MAG: AbrB/MazE/SpoVT family DNA-binding domain-containing protein [archaeon]
MAVAMSKISSKGQIVIPQNMRRNFREGDNVFFVEEGNNIVLSNENFISKKVLEDLEFARRTEEALERVEAGEFISVDSDNLEEEMMKW